MAQLIVRAAAAYIDYQYFGGVPVASTVVSQYQISRQRFFGPRPSDLRFTGTEYGDAIPWEGAASVRLAGQFWWQSEKRVTESTTGGKGAEPQQTTYGVEMDALVGLLEVDEGREVVAISRIWKNGKLIRSQVTGASAETLATVGREDAWTRLTLYTGSATQMPDPTYEAVVGAGLAPGYRGRAYVFIEGLKCDQAGNPPVLAFEVLFKASSSIETASTTDVAIARATNVNAGTLAISGQSEYLVPIGTWDTGYLTTVVNVYRVGLEQQFVGGNADYPEGRWATPVTLVDTFDVVTAGVTAGHGTSDVPLFVQTEGSTTTVYTYTVPGGARTAYVCNEADYSTFSANLRFCQSGASIVFGNNAGGSKRLHRFVATVGGTQLIAASSPVLADFVNSIVVVGAYCYAAAQNNKQVYVLDLATMALLATIDRPSVAVAHADAYPLLFELNGQAALIGNITASVVWRVWTLNEDRATWTLLGGTLPATAVQTSDLGQSIGVVGSLLVSGLNGASTYGTWTAPITVTPGTATLKATVDAICARAGMPAGTWDASALATITRPVRSAPMTQVEAVRGLLEQLRRAYPFDVINGGDKLYFKPRGAATVRTLTFGEIGAREDEANQEPLPITVNADLEVPPQVAVQFRNAANDYQVGTEVSDRLVMSGQESMRVEQTGLALLPAEAKAMADFIVAEGASAIVSGSLAVTLEHADLEPGDAVIATRRNGTTLRVRLQRRNDAGGVLSFDWVRDAASDPTSAEITDGDYTPATVVSTPTAALWQSLDVPLLRDADDGAGWYAAAKGYTAAFAGAAVMSSYNDVDFTQAATVGESAVFGVCTTLLAAWAGGSAFFDDLHSLTVSVGNGELASSTHAAMLADRSINVLRVGAEVIRFRTATQLSAAPNVYRVSGLMRGQLGTGWAMSGHVADEPCTLLRPRGLRRIETNAADVGRLIHVKVVPGNVPIARIASAPFTNTGISQKPYAPARLRALAEPGGALVHCTWHRRTRLSYVWPNTLPVPLGEAAERYEIEVLAGSPLEVVQTLTSTTPSIDITAAGSPAESLVGAVVRVYQISAAVGRGYPAETIVHG